METSSYSEARAEYQKQMANKLVGPLLAYFRKMRSDLWAESQTSILQRFQRKCSEVPKWNQDVVVDETGRLIESSGCDYLEELMTALFIAHTKVMASVRINKNSKNKKLTITVPKLDHFLHRVFTECAKSFWKAPFLFSDDLPAIERQKNLLQAEAMIEESIYSAVRDMLPIKKILQEYITDPAEDEEAPTSPPRPSEVEVEEFVSPAMKALGAEANAPAPAPAPAPLETPAPLPALIEVPAPSEKPAPAPALIEVPAPVAEEKAEVAEKETKRKKSTPELVIKEDLPSSNIKIDTEPTVQFAEQVSVFDESIPHVSEMRSIENPMNKTEEEKAAAAAEAAAVAKAEEEEDEGGQDVDVLQIGDDLGGLNDSDLEDLEGPGNDLGDVETLE
jgi:hypothetical protein